MFLELQPHIKCVIYELHKKLYRIDENWKGVLHVLELSWWQNSIKFWADSHVRCSNCVPHMAVSLRGFYWTVVLLVRSLCVISKAWPWRTIKRLLILSFGINFVLDLAHIPFSLEATATCFFKFCCMNLTCFWSIFNFWLVVLLIVECFCICGKCRKWTHDGDVL